jgi:phosphatidylinositol-3-phosphatase
VTMLGDRLPKLLRKALAPGSCAAGLLLAAGAAGAATIGDVFYIEMENHNFTQPGSQTSPGQILGNPAAPYLNSLITPGNPNAAQVSYSSTYYNVLTTPSGNNPHIHPSEPNYVWQEAGGAGGSGGVSSPLNDNDPYPNNIANAPNLSGLLQNAGITWKSYQEDTDLAKNAQGQLTSTPLPQNQWTVPLQSVSGTSADYTNPYNGSHQYNFAAKHDGQLFFTATNGGNDTSPSNPEAKYYAPLQQLQADLANNTVARYNLITPNQYNDAHSALSGGFTYHGTTYTGDQAAVAQGDNFLSILVPQIMASQAYKNNGAIVIWWDESEGGDDFSRTIPEIVISPLAKGNAYDSTLYYTHSSDLKTMQELFGVPAPGGGFLGDANTPGTNDLSDLFVPGAIPAAVPEPASVVMMGLGLAGVVVLGRRLARKSS